MMVAVSTRPNRQNRSTCSRMPVPIALMPAPPCEPVHMRCASMRRTRAHPAASPPASPAIERKKSRRKVAANKASHPAFLERGDGMLAAWYRSLYAPRAGGAYDSHHRTGGNCWPHSAARQPRGRSRLAGSSQVHPLCAQPKGEEFRYLPRMWASGIASSMPSSLCLSDPGRRRTDAYRVA